MIIDKQGLPVKPSNSAIAIDWAAVETESAQLLSRYLQFDTTNPPGNERAAVEFLAEVLRQRGFEPRLIESAPGRANLVTRLPGRKRSAGACLLYAHADVVPAAPTGWSVSPFGGQIQDGFVWGRGALDDKALGIIFLQTLTLLKQTAFPLERDVILLIAADEEVCGRYGVAWLLNYHPDLIRAEYVWDEGGLALQLDRQPSHNLYGIAIAEKMALTVKVVARGTPGHAALPQPNNPQDRLLRALWRVRHWQRPPRLTPTVVALLKTLAFHQPFPRSFLFARADRPSIWPFLQPLLENDPFFAPLVRDTVNLTMLRGGESANVISAQAEAKLDIRLLPGEDPTAVLADLRSLIADSQVTVEAEDLPSPHLPTPIQTEFYTALSETLHDLAPAGLITPYLTPGATDSRFFRQAGMKAYGFMPMLLDNHELNRIHGIDERVSTANLRWGTQVVFETLRRLG